MRQLRTLQFSLLLAVAGCVGGQTTVPAGGPVPCTPLDAGTIRAEHLGVHTLEVRWVQTKPGGSASEGATELMVDIALHGSADECAGQLIAFEVSSADGTIAASGLAKVVSTSPFLELRILSTPLTPAGVLRFASELELTLDHLDGSTIEARGTLED